jgi:hypothetical protein
MASNIRFELPVPATLAATASMNPKTLSIDPETERPGQLGYPICELIRLADSRWSEICTEIALFLREHEKIHSSSNRGHPV